MRSAPAAVRGGGGFARLLVLVLFAGLVTGLAADPVDAADYNVVPFSVSGMPITGGRGLNDGGCVVGYYQTDPADFSTAHALRRCGGLIETIDPPDSVADRRAFDVNNAGTAVGSALRPGGQEGFELDGSVVVWVAYPGSSLTVIRGINDVGDIVGEYENSDGVRHAFARIAGVFSTIDVPGATGSRARGINGLGEIVGHYDDVAGGRHGFYRSVSGVYTAIDLPGAVQTMAGDINDAGAIVGSFVDSGGAPHGFVLTAEGVAPFDVPGALGTLATGINEGGQLTGEFIDGAGVHEGFVATPSLFADGFESGNFSGWSSVQP